MGKPPRPVIDHLGNRYANIGDAARSLGIDRVSISAHLNGRAGYGHAGGFTFRVDDGSGILPSPPVFKHGTWTLSDMQQWAAKLGGKCLSDRYVSLFEKLNWECAAGHHWAAHWANVHWRKSWCPNCAGQAPHDLEWARALAARRGFELLSTEFRTVHAKMSWRCGKGHEWRATAAKINGGNRGCPECAGTKLKTVEAAKELAIKRGGTLLSTIYTGNKARLLWRCAKGHEFGANYNNVHSGWWCPICGHKESKNERALFSWLSAYVSDLEPRRRRILKGRPRFELDIFSSSLKKAIEFDGPTHFEPIYGKTNLKRQRANDAVKDSLCRQQGIELLRVRWDAYDADPEVQRQRALAFLRAPAL